jgi:hypothetical protein
MPADFRRTIETGLAAAAAILAASLLALWRVLKPVLVFAGNLLLALVVIFEEWGWQPLAAALARLAQYRPWALIEQWIARLPPYGALAAFAMPAVLLFPLKLVALWLMAGGHYLVAGLLFVGAKLAGTAFLARIFMLTRPALMTIGWFASAYERFMPWKEAAEAWLRASWAWRYGRIVKARVKKSVAGAWARLRPGLAQLRQRLGDGLAGLTRQARVRLKALFRLIGGRRTSRS